MHPEIVRRLNKIKKGKSQVIIEEVFHTRMIFALIDYLIELKTDISSWGIMTLEPYLARSTLKNYTNLDLNSPTLSVKLNATYEALRAALTRYIQEMDEGLLYRIPFYGYFFPSPQANIKRALMNFIDNGLITIYSELLAEVDRVNIKSAKSTIYK